MKTYLIDLDGINPEIFKNLMGFVLTVGLNFRKIDQKTESGTGKTLFVELSTKSEETALKAFLEKLGINSPIVIGDANKANLKGKKLGVFSAVSNPEGNHYQDKTTGKKFAIVEEK
jgi:hypothetical protein